MRQFSLRVALLLILCACLASAQTKSDKLFKKSGDVINGSITNSVLVFSTPYGEMRVAPRYIRKFEHQQTTDRIYTFLNEVITGHLVSEEIEIDRGYATSDYQKEIIDRIIFAEREPVQRTLGDYFEMQNGDTFYGKVNNARFMIFEPDDPTDPITIDFSYILKIEAANNGMTRVYLTTGDVVTGGIATKQLDVTLNYGFDVAIPKNSIKTVSISR